MAIIATKLPNSRTLIDFAVLVVAHMARNRNKNLYFIELSLRRSQIKFKWNAA